MQRSTRPTRTRCKGCTLDERLTATKCDDRFWFEIVYWLRRPAGSAGAAAHDVLLQHCATTTTSRLPKLTETIKHAVQPR